MTEHVDASMGSAGGLVKYVSSHASVQYPSHGIWIARTS